MIRNIRNQIIETAAELFYKNGYNLTGINEIIEKSDIAKATLYSHFKSKEDILLAYLDYMDHEAFQKLLAYCSSKPKGNKRLVAPIEFVREFFHDNSFNGCWCVNSLAEIPKDNKRVRNKIKSNKSKFRNFLIDLVKENRRDLSKRKTEVLADRIYLLYESALTESHLHHDVWPIDTAIGLLKDILKT